MPYVTLTEGAEMFYKDWGPSDGPVILLSHGWPLNSDAWEATALFLAENGFRAIAHEGGAHGLPDTDRERLHADLLQFARC